MRQGRLIAVLGGGIAIACAFIPAAAHATPAAIRVGGPSAPDDVKVAIVGSDKRLKGKRFEVLDESDSTVGHGRLEKASGRSGPWRHAYSADLTAITAPGSYRVSVGKLTSADWPVASAGSDPAIGEILIFFRSNRDGSEPSPTHDPSHLNDAVIHPDAPAHGGEEVGLTGGWMDAGDMIHFTLTTAFGGVDPAPRRARLGLLRGGRGSPLAIARRS